MNYRNHDLINNVNYLVWINRIYSWPAVLTLVTVHFWEVKVRISSRKKVYYIYITHTQCSSADDSSGNLTVLMTNLLMKMTHKWSAMFKLFFLKLNPGVISTTVTMQLWSTEGDFAPVIPRFMTHNCNVI